MGITRYPHGVSSYGIPLIGGGGAGMIFGNVYWVRKSTDTGYEEWYEDHNTVYNDGTSSVFNTIQAAVDATQADRGDVIFVYPGKWEEDVVILEHDGIRIIGAGFGTGANDTGCRLRSNDCATKAGTGGGSVPYPFTSKIGNAANSAAFHCVSRGVEITGFYFDGGGGTCGLYLGGGLNGGLGALTNSDGDVVDDETASGCWIHHNYFRGGSEGTIGLYLNGAKFGCVIEDNIFERWTGAAIDMDAGNASNECSIIRRNTFTADNGGYGIDIYGEANSCIGCQINSNFFGDRVSHAFAMAIYNRASSSGVLSVSDNHFATSKWMVLTTADWVSGNTYGFAGSATEDNNYALTENEAGAENT